MSQDEHVFLVALSVEGATFAPDDAVVPPTSLPRDEHGNVITSAEFGQRDWFVEITYNTDFDGRVIDPEKEEYPRTLHGPFVSGEEAQEWMDAYPDGDTDLHDINAFQINAVRPA